MILSRFERMIARRYLLPGKGEGFIFLVAAISLVAVMLGVAALIIVMSVMNGFRAELFEKIVGLNGHAVVQGYDGRLPDWRRIMEQTKATPGVTSATPLIEQPLLANFNGRVEAVLVRGMTMDDIRGNETLKGKVKVGSLTNLAPGRNVIAIGSGLADNLGVTVGNTISIINPAGRSTPFGTVPREIGYEIGAVFEVGVYDYDKAFVIMPMQNAQQLLLLGDTVGMIEVKTVDADKVGDILAPLADKVEGKAVVTDWRQMNSSLFEALQVDRIVMLHRAFAHHSGRGVQYPFFAHHAGARQDARHRDHADDGRAAGKPAQDFRHRRRHHRFARYGGGRGAGLHLPLLPRECGALHSAGDGAEYLGSVGPLPCRAAVQADPVEIVVICLMAVGFSFLATLYPAFKAANTDPVQVLRYE
jgi:lipoprotein-releasing system permease protein